MKMKTIVFTPRAVKEFDALPEAAEDGATILTFSIGRRQTNIYR